MHHHLLKTINKLTILLASFFVNTNVFSQDTLLLTHEDTLRGSNNPNRDWWDALHYAISVTPDFKTKNITGKVVITYLLIKNGQSLMQIDLQSPMEMDSAKSRGVTLPFKRNSLNTWLIKVENKGKSTKGLINQLEIYYHGAPHIALKAPWDGGWVWKKDKLGRDWVSVACQGIGASLWYPCKDYQGDEPDSGATFSITVPDTFTVVSNGRLKNITNNQNGYQTVKWGVKSPINLYNIVPYIGHYKKITDTFNGLSGTLDVTYWMLDYHIKQAQAQFTQVKKMLEAFEYWFGPYPFYTDGYQLVEAPYLGMEHQSAVAYGNGFVNGYAGKDLSATGWGLKWDFMIVHESGHEWFGNSVSTKDIADEWVHEGFTNYSEVLFTEYWYGKQAGNEYCVGLRKKVLNDIPIIGPYGVNKPGSDDRYYKAANMIQTIRHSVDDDSLFRTMLKNIQKKFYHKTITTGDIETFISKSLHYDYQPVFNQYLRQTNIPTLEYKLNKENNTIECRYTDCVKGFNLPLAIGEGNKIFPTSEWKKFTASPKNFPNFNKEYIQNNYYLIPKEVE